MIAAGGENAFFAAAFRLAFESALESSLAFGFSGGTVGAGALRARSSCVDMEFSRLVSTSAGVDTKDLVASGILTSCEFVIAGASVLRAGIERGPIASMSLLVISGDSSRTRAISGSGASTWEIVLRTANPRESHCCKGRRPTIIPIPKLGMAIHNNNKPNADNPAGFDLFRGTMVTDAKSHSFSRNPGKFGLEP